MIRIRGDLRSLPLESAAGQPLDWPAVGRVAHAWLRNDGRVVDELVVVTNGDGAELHVHGGTGVLDAVAAWLEQRGVRCSRAVAPVATPSCLRHATAELSCRTGPLSRLAAEATAAVRAGRLPAALRQRLLACERRSAFARVLERPPCVRIVGRPNAGKSTLFNALLRGERSLVSPEPGTTRDTVRARFLLRSTPVVLEDTAGAADQTGISRRADLLVHVLTDGEQPVSARVVGAPRIAMIEVRGRADRCPAPDGCLPVSGLTGRGVEELRQAAGDRLGIPSDEADDVLTPVDPVLRRLVAAALHLPPAPLADADGRRLS